MTLKEVPISSSPEVAKRPQDSSSGFDHRNFMQWFFILFFVLTPQRLNMFTIGMLWPLKILTKNLHLIVVRIQGKRRKLWKSDWIINLDKIITVPNVEWSRPTNAVQWCWEVVHPPRDRLEEGVLPTPSSLSTTASAQSFSQRAKYTQSQKYSHTSKQTRYSQFHIHPILPKIKLLRPGYFCPF